jgi:hypothetical protein
VSFTERTQFRRRSFVFLLTIMNEMSGTLSILVLYGNWL